MKFLKRFVPAVAVAILLVTQIPAYHKDEVKGESLIGTWQIDLRPTPDADAYYKDFIVESVDGRDFKGMFYDTPITNGKINTDWGAVYFAFTTADGSGTYNHSGVLRNGKLEGLSHSLGRGFLSVWKGEKKK